MAASVVAASVVAASVVAASVVAAAVVAAADQGSDRDSAAGTAGVDGVVGG